jgi:hypothetical protein
MILCAYVIWLREAPLEFRPTPAALFTAATITRTRLKNISVLLAKTARNVLDEGV